MTFNQLLAKYVSGNLTSDQLPKVAVIGLAEGLDSPSLCILAGLPKNETPSQIDFYFTQALSELKIGLPTKRQAAIVLALALADEILNGNKDIIEGTREMKYKAIDTYDFFSESAKYCYDSIGFETAYGLYDTYDELSNATNEWQEDKTNQQLMKEVKSQLFEELKNWKAKINGA